MQHIIMQKGHCVFGHGLTIETAIADMKQWINSDDPKQEWTADDFPTSYHSASDGEFVLMSSDDFMDEFCPTIETDNASPEWVNDTFYDFNHHRDTAELGWVSQCLMGGGGPAYGLWLSSRGEWHYFYEASWGRIVRLADDETSQFMNELYDHYGLDVQHALSSLNYRPEVIEDDECVPLDEWDPETFRNRIVAENEGCFHVEVTILSAQIDTEDYEPLQDPIGNIYVYVEYEVKKWIDYPPAT